MEKTNSNKEITSLEANATNMQSTIDELQGKINSISNTLNSINANTENTTIKSSSKNSSDSKYVEITKTLENTNLLSVTDAKDNNDGTYTLKGKIITVDTSKEPETEYPYYKETGEYKQITVASNIKCVYSVDSYEEETDTVQNVFSKKLYFGGCFNFSFENEKCISVYEVVTGH